MISWIQFESFEYADRVAWYAQRVNLICQCLQLQMLPDDANHHDVSMIHAQIFKKSHCVKLPYIFCHRVFDETNATIGEAWTWDFDSYYFARESDAVWFATRWR